MAPIQLADIADVHDKSFDYVVVGAGTSGLALATRLAEDPSVSVLVLEAGKYHGDDPTTRLPAMYAKNFGNPDYDWAFSTTPQPHADNTIYHWNRGKGLGGSSALNFYVWNRPPAIDIDAWEKLGNPGWNWANYLKYSNKSIKFIPPPDAKVKAERQTSDPAYHGTDGPIAVGFANGSPGWDVTLQDTLKKIGIKTVTDGSGGQGIGSFMVTSTVDPRTNARTYSVDYVPSPQPSNLKILPLATVARVVLSQERPGSDAIATGVEILHDGQKKTVKVGKEVLVSAGAIKTPQILELSGIGDHDILQKAGVETVVDLPAVGSNVQEHLFTGVSWELNAPENFNTLDPLHVPEIAAENLQLYQKGEGLFVTGLLNLTHTPLSLVSTRADAIHGAFAEKVKAGKYSGKPGLSEQLEVQLDLAKNGAETELISFPGFLSYPNTPEPGKKYISLCPAINHPFSRGTIHIASTDPNASPTIDPHYFEEDIDLQTFLEQVKFARRVGTLAPLSAHVGKEINPGPDVKTDEQLVAWLKKYMTTTYHTVGSCAMLPRAKGGVVDPQLKVYGTANVRVVDLSIVPLHIASHTQATAYAIAEQAADIIKGVFKA
ncbi:GMC oxidoreductase [Auriscalpium vulgare]|uniref:GMC oxidoreductase n=1 Tax=Auriscalpium vulgare TaxID=40419 RepID=A0ACB8RZM6_9AGAM|nr:GMC oxidoreductase [Auriscalpium vulgare]